MEPGGDCLQKEARRCRAGPLGASEDAHEEALAELSLGNKATGGTVIT